MIINLIPSTRDVLISTILFALTHYSVRHIGTIVPSSSYYLLPQYMYLLHIEDVLVSIRRRNGLHPDRLFLRQHPIIDGNLAPQSKFQNPAPFPGQELGFITARASWHYVMYCYYIAIVL